MQDMEIQMLVLLVSLDRLFRKALVRECQDVGQGIKCVESDDGIGAMFAPALERMDLVVLDAGLVEHHGAAWLTNWRRMAPNGAVLVLDPAGEHTLSQVRQTVVRILQRIARA
jgi:DNA-binding response OmpR family regulator